MLWSLSSRKCADMYSLLNKIRYFQSDLEAHSRLVSVLITFLLAFTDQSLASDRFEKALSAVTPIPFSTT
jgi:hypothetical protein